ncbi:MAG: DNA polymerase beta superfamily protein [Halopenitus sp.]
MDERSHRRLDEAVGGWTPAELARIPAVALADAGAVAGGCDPGYYALVGSHAYGFATAESDVDVRGFHLADGRRYALLDRPAARVQVPAITDREADPAVPAPVEFESLELRAFADALAGGDFALFEAVLAAPVVRDDVPAAVDSLRNLLRDHLPLDLPQRYVGMARSLYSELEAASDVDGDDNGDDVDDDSDGDGAELQADSLKKALYALRAVYAAEYVDEHGCVVADVRDLARAVDGDPALVAALLDARRDGGWPARETDGESSLYDRTLAALERRLDAADYAESTAAERAAFRTALDEWQCETRGWSL